MTDPTPTPTDQPVPTEPTCRYKLQWWWKGDVHAERVASHAAAITRFNKLDRSKVRGAAILRAETTGINANKYFLHQILK